CHFSSLKSSTREFGIAAFAFELALMFEGGVFALTLLLRFSLRVLAFRLLVLLFELRFASTRTITSRPPPMTMNAASKPSIHQTALDFLRGGAAERGCGVHCGAGGGGGGGGVVGLGLTTGGGCCGR